MDVIIQTVFCADAEARCCRITDTIGGLVEELDAELQRRRDLSRHSAPVDAEIMRAPRGTDLTAAASEGRPFSPVLLHPDRQQNRRLAIADRSGATWQKDARKHCDIESELILVKNPVLRGELDIAESEGSRPVQGEIEANRQRCGEL